MRPKALTSSYVAMLTMMLLAFVASPTSIAMADELKTLKERLSGKASDEQRVNNCGVPPEQRGSKRRPGCPEERKPPMPAAGQASESAPPR